MTNALKTTIVATVALIALAVSSSAANAQGYSNIKYKFGMNVKLTQNGFQKGLLVRSVTPGGAADRAGLRPGTIILSSNGRNFQGASNDHHGVAILQDSVTSYGGGDGGVDTFTTQTQQTYRAHLHVIMPCGTVRHIDCFPYPNFGGIDTF